MLYGFPYNSEGIVTPLPPPPKKKKEGRTLMRQDDYMNANPDYSLVWFLNTQD